MNEWYRKKSHQFPADNRDLTILKIGGSSWKISARALDNREQK